VTQLRTFRLACLAPGDQAPILPGSFERAAGVIWSKRTLDAFLAEIDAGAELPDAVLSFDGARIARVLRRHERCALLPILVFGAPGAALPPGCDAIVQNWSANVAELVIARECLRVRDAEPARDSERRAKRFADWMTQRGHADAADAAAFGLEAPYSLFHAWRDAGWIQADLEGGWRATPRLAGTVPETHAVEPPRSTDPIETFTPITQAREPRSAARFAWPVLLLTVFALVAAQGGGILGSAPETAGERRPSLEERLLLGEQIPIRTPSPSPPKELEIVAPVPVKPEPVIEGARLVAAATLHRSEEVMRAAEDGELHHRRPAGGGFAKGEVLGALFTASVQTHPPPTRAERVAAAAEREAIAFARYEQRRVLAAEGVLAWREVAPDWEALEAARAARSAAEASVDPEAPASLPPQEKLLHAAQSGIRLQWLAPHRSVLRTGDEVLRYETAEAWLEVQLAAGEWSPAADIPRAEARWDGPPEAWRPVRLLSEEPQSDGSVRLRFEVPEPRLRAESPTHAEVRWSLAVR